MLCAAPVTATPARAAATAPRAAARPAAAKAAARPAAAKHSAALLRGKALRQNRAPAAVGRKAAGRAGAMRVQAAVAADTGVEQLRFLTPELAEKIRSEVGTPAYAYSLAGLRAQGEKALAFPNAFGLTPRFAMKACPNAAVLQIFSSMGIHIDASSGYEVERAVQAGIPESHISLSSQELPTFFPDLVNRGTKINACSLSQLERFGQAFPGGTVGVRFNPGTGSGGNGKTNVGGPDSSFGIWFEQLPEVQAIVAKYDLKVERIHTHIGSGSDPAVWQKVSGMSLDLCRQFPDVTVLNLGGGYKVGRMDYEASTDLAVVGVPVKDAFVKFAEETGRKLHLEIEPGTFLVANNGAVVSTIQDIVSTGAKGHTFLKTDTGMTELLRPSLYGSQHPIVVVPAGGKATATTEEARYIVVGHCCESGDLVSPAPNEPETLLERPLGKAAIGDLIVMEGSGAYCSSMSTKHYNSYPEAAEVLVDGDAVHVIRKRQDYNQIWANEVPLPGGVLGNN